MTITELAERLHLVHVRPPAQIRDLPPVRGDDFVYLEDITRETRAHRIVKDQCPPLPHSAPWHQWVPMRVAEVFERNLRPRWCETCWPQVALCGVCRRPSGWSEMCPDCLERDLDTDDRFRRAA